jgi:4'-phosphopantetheinyl transferase
MRRPYSLARGAHEAAADTCSAAKRNPGFLNGTSAIPKERTGPRLSTMRKEVANRGIRGQLRLNADEVQVWCARLDVGSEELLAFNKQLSTDEKERAARFSIAVERDRFVAARAILREFLGAYVHELPVSLSFERSALGKPRLHRRPGAPDLRFNLSHSHNLALFAFSLGREIGVDIEKILPKFANEGIAEQYFSAREQEDLRATPNEDRAEAFFRCWTRKEAYIKARGDGLDVPLDSFTVSLKRNGFPKLWSADSENWKIYSLKVQPGFAGAMVVERPECRVLYLQRGCVA